MSYENEEKTCYICKEKLEHKYVKDKKYHKIRDHCHCTSEYRGAAHDICSLKYIILQADNIIFHNASNYVYHFIIKELA